MSHQNHCQTVWDVVSLCHTVFPSPHTTAGLLKLKNTTASVVYSHFTDHGMFLFAYNDSTILKFELIVSVQTSFYRFYFIYDYFVLCWHFITFIKIRCIHDMFKPRITKTIINCCLHD